MPPAYNPLARKPLQKRSIERIETILATTETLLVELPFEDINTNLIAKRSEVKIGSLYHFFPDKFAIYNSLIFRALGHIDVILQDELKTLEDSQQGSNLIDALISRLTEVSKGSSISMTLWFNMQKHPETLKIVEHFESSWIPAMAKHYMASIPLLTQQRAELAVFIILQSVYTLLDQAAYMEEEQGELFLKEGCYSLNCYIDALQKLPKEKIDVGNEQAKKSWPLQKGQPRVTLE